jgi:Putative Actinobacterial Holin-X, holin superfamily III
MTNTIHPNELRAQPVRNLLPRLSQDISMLLRQEAELARDEVKSKRGVARSVVRSSALFAATAVMAMLAISAAAVVGLAMVMPLWAAFLIVGALYAIAALAFSMTTRGEMKRAGGLLPPRLERYLSGPEPTKAKLEDDARGVEAAWDRVDRTIAALSNKNDIAGPMRDAVLAMGALSIAIASSLKTEQGRN